MTNKKGKKVEAKAKTKVNYPEKYTVQTMLNYISEKHEIPKVSAKEIVEDIFDTTIIENGQIKINYEKTDVVSILEETKNFILGEKIKEHKTGVELILKSDGKGNPKYIMTDSRKLKQVLMNLLRNALKFTDKGYIEFGFTEINNTVNKCIQFYVKDTGIGID